MFVGAFQNGLKASNFNESLTHKPNNSMEESMVMEECYVKGEESNVEKRIKDANHCNNRWSKFSSQCINKFPQPG